MSKMQVYILRCSDNSYYTGVSNDVMRRLQEHNNGLNRSSYTYRRLPVILAWVSDELWPDDAIDFEKQVKRWTRKKKEALINGQWHLLPMLSKCLNKSCHEYYNKKKLNR